VDSPPSSGASPACPTPFFSGCRSPHLCPLVQVRAAGVMIFAEPRFGTANPRRTRPGRLGDAKRGIDRVVGDCWKAAPRIPATLFWWGRCPSEGIKLDLAKAAERHQKPPGLRGRVRV